jgi:hypothetical protein
VAIPGGTGVWLRVHLLVAVWLERLAGTTELFSVMQGATCGHHGVALFIVPVGCRATTLEDRVNGRLSAELPGGGGDGFSLWPCA